MSPAQNLTETLPSLTQTELREIQVRVQLLLTETSKVNTSKDLVYTIMAITLKSVGVIIPPTLKQNKKRKWYKNFNTGADKFLTYCNKHFQFDDLPHMEQRKLLHTLLDMILISLPKNNFAILPVNMCNGLGRIDITVEDQFPNYLANGLLLAVLHGDLTWQT